MTMRGIQKIAERSWTSPEVLTGGAAGIGAMALTNSLMQGSIAAKEQAFKAALGNYASARSAPLIAGAVTALLVGAMVASKMRRGDEEAFKNSQRFLAAQRAVPKTQPGDSSGDFLPGERLPFPSPYKYPDPILGTVGY